MKYCNDPKPFGHWTRKHIAADPRCSYQDVDSLNAAMRAGFEGFPQLEPVMRMYGTYLYAEADVERWFREHAQWRMDEPQRRAARRAAELAQVGTLTPEAEAFTARAGVNQDILRQQQEASEEFRKERSDYFKSRGWKE